MEALSGKTFCASAYGWWGEGWEWFEEPIEEYTADDRITFGADGTLTITQGETLRIYNDCVPGGEEYTVEGPAKWRIVTDEGDVKVQFVDGGFPLMLAGMGENPSDLNYHYGLDAMWTLQSKGLSRVFSNTTVQKHQFFGAQLSSQSNSHIHTRPLENP